MAIRTPKANSVYSQTTDVLRRKNLNVFSRISRALNDSFVANYLKNNSNARLAIVVQTLGERVPSASTERYTLQRLHSERFENNTIQRFAAAKVRIVEFGDYSIGDPSNEEFIKKVFNTTNLNEFASLNSAAAALDVNLALRDMHPTAVAVDDSIVGLNFGDVVLVEVDDAINPNDIKILSVAARRVIAEPQFGSSGTILNPEPPLNNIDGGSSSTNQPDEITPGEQTIFLDRLVKAGLPQVNSFIDPAGVSLTESINGRNTSWHGALRRTDDGPRLHLGLDVYCDNSNSKYPAGVFVPLKNNFDPSLNFIIKKIKYFKINDNNEQVKNEHKHDFLFAVAKEDINYNPADGSITSPNEDKIAFFKTSDQITESNDIDSVYVVEEKNKFIEFFYNGNEETFKEQMRSSGSSGTEHIVFHIPGFQAEDVNNEFLHESSYTTSHQVATNMVGFNTGTNVSSTSLANLNTYVSGGSPFDVYKLNMRKNNSTGVGLNRGGYYIPPVRFIAEQGFRFSATKTTGASLGSTGFNLICEIKHSSMNGIVKPNKSLYLLFYHLSGFPLNILKNQTVFNENFPQEHFAYLGSTSIRETEPHYHFELITNMDGETDSLFINYIDAVKRRNYGYIGARIGFDPSRLYTDGAKPNSSMSTIRSYFSSNQTGAQEIYNNLPAPATQLEDGLIREFPSFQENYLNARKRNFQ